MYGLEEQYGVNEKNKKQKTKKRKNKKKTLRSEYLLFD